MQKSFKLISSRDEATTFLPLNSRIGGHDRDSHLTVGQYLTRDQARNIYKKVETGKIINVDMVKHGIEQEKQLSRIDDDSGEVNPYRGLMVNNAEKIEMQKSQVEEWSVLSNLLNYVQHSKFNTMSHSLNIKPVNRYKVRPNEESEGKQQRRLS